MPKHHFLNNSKIYRAFHRTFIQVVKSLSFQLLLAQYIAFSIVNYRPSICLHSI